MYAYLLRQYPLCEVSLHQYRYLSVHIPHAGDTDVQILKVLYLTQGMPNDGTHEEVQGLSNFCSCGQVEANDCVTVEFTLDVVEYTT